MSNRITREMLDRAVTVLNNTLGTPVNTFKAGTRCDAEPFNIHIEHSNGGYKLVQNSETVVGSKDIIAGRRKPGELYGLIHALIDGAELAQRFRK
jgi:hypothetical protein